ncbi:Cof-type HAD-IIB family hydrolase [Sporolactobacillus sp. THM19-2]|jgi:Cof subfamily protein (haloacid dehalogenase superfamily)|uniref:Cof-type HAD-IIB family hydrolase n=1 Tax=Sporolactobacillus sp. THM19-2 TaxID=2511171 RepID=UPI00101F574B|nr:Cof-type HAD-IIB family hydrolase [Sporolactobacillus sp. THM19-2]RYL94485.1 HAD family phosphatase [Sporolactobacillus sp. THM19-2]
MTIKLIFSDIDGTLLNSSHRISSGTRDAIREVSDHNIPFILVSARMPAGILPIQEELGIRQPIVSYSGALVLDTPDPEGPDQPLLNISMDRHVVQDIYQLVCKRFPSISFSTYSLNQWLVVSPENQWIEQEHRIARTPFKIFDFGRQPLSIYPPINKLLCMGPPEDIIALENALTKEDLPAAFYRSKPTYLEIAAQNASKSAALALLIKHYHVKKEETLAFGDNFNDVDMLKFASIGIAMGNAPDEVKKSADRVTLSNDEDGIVQGLKDLHLI